MVRSPLDSAKLSCVFFRSETFLQHVTSSLSIAPGSVQQEVVMEPQSNKTIVNCMLVLRVHDAKLNLPRVYPLL